jgi:membrane peptidoglycan carboxypeptidase
MRGGITIRSTFDRDMQRAADRALNRYFRITDNPIGAIAIVEPGTGKVKALAVNRPYGVDKKKRQNSINLAAHQPLAESSGAQPGSTFKPFVAAAALEQGYGFRYSIFAPRELVRQLRMSTCDGSVTEEPNIGRKDEYTPNNESASEHGVYDMRRAMWDSVNTYFLQLSEKTGLCRPAEIVNAMGCASPATAR